MTDLKKNYYFNNDILSLVYNFDPTFHIIFRNEVLPYLKKMWVIEWTCKKTLTKGINYNGFSGLNFNYNYISCAKKYTYINCKKKCAEKNNFYNGFYHNPIIFNKDTINSINYSIGL